MFRKISFLFFVITIVFFAFSLPTNAQIKSDDISLSINPKQPGPNETVYATLASYAVDLNKTLITWSTNGQDLVQGVGQKTFSFKTGASGAQTVLGVKIDATDGSSANKQITIAPATVDLLWEAVDSYVPPFYKGKALVPTESAVKVVALLNSKNSNGAIYNWKLDDKAKTDSSGYGKNYYYFQKTYLDKTNSVRVSVTNILGNTVGTGKLDINNQSPKIVFYKKDPKLGTMWEQALKDYFQIKSEGELIVVEPYFISPKNLISSDLKLTWELNGSPVATPTTKKELGIKPESKNGSSIIKVTVENIKSMFLNSSQEINVKF
ncbi:MAG TPA: hypothetical protein PLO44_01605 [Candidatus Paceibacterota bacterium]|nr:hypothetical protein [Candidatus Paceibacterota bacterium]